MEKQLETIISVNFNLNSTKTIGLSTFDFYEVTVDEAKG